jgi:SLBB domain
MSRRCVAWRAICCTLLGVLLSAAAPDGCAAAGPSRAAAQGAAARESRSESERREQRHCYAVMGEVAAAGVYASQAEHLVLEDLIQQAGGLTPRANRGVRVIRGSRAILNTRSNEGLRFRLLPGDVVIAMSDDSQAIQIAPRGTPVVADAETPVQVALVNLIGRPVVLKLRPRHANLITLLRLLGQHPNVARFVRIIGSRDPSKLRAGSVLVFDRRVIDPRRIPSLPGVVAPRPPRAKETVVRAASTSNSTSQGEIRRVQGTDDDARKVTNSSGRVLTTVPPPPFPSAGTDGVAGSGSADGLRTAARSADVEKPDLRPQPPMPPAEKPTVDGDLVRKADREESAADESKASIDFVTLVIGVFALLGVLSAAGLLISMGRRAIWGQARAARSPARLRSRLERLLHNEFEIVVEPMTLPSGQSFFGRAAGLPRNRIDDEHAPVDIQRPHIDAQAAAAKSATSATKATTRRTDGPQPHPTGGGPSSAKNRPPAGHPAPEPTPSAGTR